MDDKSIKLMFVGYERSSDNYRLFDPATKKIKVSRNVIFDEHTTIDTEGRIVQISINNDTEKHPEDRDLATDLDGERVDANTTNVEAV